ncbi:MAG TPA: BlaI/MecI/CopY family transcriptional regulator [Candidatus Krumholzibacteria bacterium]|nr:BlaI/MecI/CopY family transcriptional regulator [Candidatus Krumholzibacteria bacterium]
MREPEISRLGDLEFAVLEHFWDHGRADAKAVHAALGRERGITLNTVQSTLKRLHGKGLLDRTKVSHAHVYAPALSRTDFQTLALRRVVERVSGGSAAETISAFVDLTESIDPEQLEHLERLVARRIEQRRRTGES